MTSASSTGELLRKLQEGEGDEALRGCTPWMEAKPPGKGTGAGGPGGPGFEAEFGRRPQAAPVQRTGPDGRSAATTPTTSMAACCAAAWIWICWPAPPPNGTDLVRIQSEGYPALEVDLRDLRVREEEKNSPRPGAGVAARLAELGCRPAGFDAYVTSTVLSGSGLSSLPPPMRSWWLPS